MANNCKECGQRIPKKEPTEFEDFYQFYTDDVEQAESFLKARSEYIDSGKALPEFFLIDGRLYKLGG